MQKARITGPLLPSAFADDASRVNGQYKLLIAGMLRSETPSERQTALLDALSAYLSSPGERSVRAHRGHGKLPIERPNLVGLRPGASELV